MENRELKVKSFNLYPAEVSIIEHFNDEQQFNSLSFALRRIIREWAELKASHSPTLLESPADPYHKEEA
jgi:hypothetical protein